MYLELHADDGKVVDTWTKDELESLSDINIGSDVRHVMTKKHSRSICDCKGIGIGVDQTGMPMMYLLQGPSTWHHGA